MRVELISLPLPTTVCVRCSDLPAGCVRHLSDIGAGYDIRLTSPSTTSIRSSAYLISADGVELMLKQPHVVKLLRAHEKKYAGITDFIQRIFLGNLRVMNIGPKEKHQQQQQDSEPQKQQTPSTTAAAPAASVAAATPTSAAGSPKRKGKKRQQDDGATIASSSKKGDSEKEPKKQRVTTSKPGRKKQVKASVGKDEPEDKEFKVYEVLQKQTSSSGVKYQSQTHTRFDWQREWPRLGRWLAFPAAIARTLSDSSAL